MNSSPNLNSPPSIDYRDVEGMLQTIAPERQPIYRAMLEHLEKSVTIQELKTHVSQSPHSQPTDESRMFCVSLAENELGGNHYAHVYAYLLLYHEAKGDITPRKTRLLETTSGSAGIACACIAKKLGYPCTIMIPEGGEKAREDAITQYGAEIIRTSKEEYTNGFPEAVKNYLIQHKNERKNGELFFLSHSQGPRESGGKKLTVNEPAVFPLEEVTRRALQNIKARLGPNEPLRHMTLAIGNGITALASGRVARGEFRMSCVAFEPVEGANVYMQRTVGSKTQAILELERQSKGIRRHNLPGLSPPGNKIPFPALDEANPLIARIRLVCTSMQLTALEEQYGPISPREVVPYDLPIDEPGSDTWGRSTCAAYHVTHTTVETTPGTAVLFQYDKSDRYDTPIETPVSTNNTYPSRVQRWTGAA